MHEIDEKVERLARLATAQGLGGILLNTQPNFCVADGRPIESHRRQPRERQRQPARQRARPALRRRQQHRNAAPARRGVGRAGFTPCEYPWTEEQARPGHRRSRPRSARSAARRRIGCDSALPGGTPIDAGIAATRALLTPAEASRYRALGRDLGRVVGEVCRGLVPDLEETEIAQRVAAAVAGVGARAVVTLVAADDRIGRFRHPAPTRGAVAGASDGGGVRATRRARRGACRGSSSPAESRTRSRPGRGRPRACSSGCWRPPNPARPGPHLFGVAAQAYADAGFAARRNPASPGRRDRLPIARVDRAPGVARNRASAAGVCVEPEHHRHEGRRDRVA